MWKYLLIVPAIIILSGLLIGVEVLLAKRGPNLDFHNPPRTPVSLGTGPALTYVVLGDSTAAGEGASSYRTGIAVMTSSYLAKSHTVRYINLAVSGARAKDVLDEQISKAAAYKPDVVLLAVGANDVMHLSSLASVRKSVTTSTDTLIGANCDVKIVLTGSPDMGGPTRLPQPLRWLAGERAKSLNNHVFTPLALKQKLTFAPIADTTGPLFRANPGLLAADHFHPNDKGYATWEPVLEKALDSALRVQPSHCE